METNLSTNLVKRQQDLQSVINTANSGSFLADVELKRQELNDAKESLEDTAQQLKSEINFYSFCISNCSLSELLFYLMTCTFFLQMLLRELKISQRKLGTLKKGKTI